MGGRGEWHSLGAGEVDGVPDTQTDYPVAFAQAEDHSLGWLELGLRYDTRDSQRLPYRGFDVGANVHTALFQSDWDVGAIFSLFGSKVLPVPPLLHDGGDPDEENPPTDTIALHLQTQATAGKLPFFSLPTLGGSRTLRGFIEGRFRDRAAWHASAEYRFWVLSRGFPIPFTQTLRVERLGLAFFGDVGSVEDDWNELFGARVHASVGVGMRLTLERTAPFRVDVGFSKDGIEVAAGFGLSF
jgi:outer membrane protein assembly factor BamA